MNHLKLYEEELSPFTRELFLINNYIHIFFEDQDNNRVKSYTKIRKSLGIFERALNKAGVKFLFTDYAIPYYIILAPEYKSTGDVWRKIPINNEIISRVRVNAIEGHKMQMWDLYFETFEDGTTYDVYFVGDEIYRASGEPKPNRAYMVSDY